MGENTFVDSGGAALIQAQRALFNRGRRAKERVRWGFSPEKDPRVASLLRWVLAMSNGLTTIGLQKFLQTRQRGALIANADFRADSPLGVPAQPAFDWITLDDLQSTLDRVFQESVAFYDPAFQVIVFVFLLSPTGNSMAVWRRRLPVPESLRNAYQREILLAKRDLPDDYPVYVDELPTVQILFLASVFMYHLLSSLLGVSIREILGSDYRKTADTEAQTAAAEDSIYSLVIVRAVIRPRDVQRRTRCPKPVDHEDAAKPNAKRYLSTRSWVTHPTPSSATEVLISDMSTYDDDENHPQLGLWCRSNEYFIEYEMVIIRPEAGCCIYRVHRYVLERD
ncbi:hypothetical protein A0H81_04073 [Grifola frondosa]|uniref:CcmS related domain-containing protein n=1 Tax=Grifola frondosa TaxID=5627 RepID=A0A1C7MJY7_GRIFR|nr:hypothetical protein A0H81_04073 [Grifola frondosa]